jgi:hypothetical protein
MPGTDDGMDMMNPDDLARAVELLNGVRGLTAWGAHHSVGSLVSVEFGEPRTDDPARGRYGLFLYQTAWRWETDQEILMSSEDPPATLRETVPRLNSRTVTAVRVESPSLSARFDFDDGSRLRTFTIRTLAEDATEHWMMFLPDNRVFVAGPGGHWSIEAANQNNQPEVGR